MILAAGYDKAADVGSGGAGFHFRRDAQFLVGTGRAAGQPLGCGCRQSRPCRSSCMCVLVQDAGESVLSPDVEVIQSARICDRFRSWAQGCCTVQGPMGAVPVVEQLELPQCVQQVGLIPEQGAVQELAPAGLHPPLHDRIHPGCADGARDDVDALANQHGIERLGELGVAVTDQVLRRGPLRPAGP